MYKKLVITIKDNVTERQYEEFIAKLSKIPEISSIGHKLGDLEKAIVIVGGKIKGYQG